MTKQELKYFIKTFGQKQNSFLIGLLSGLLLFSLILMLFFAISKVDLCQVMRCNNKYQSNKITASAETEVDDDKSGFDLTDSGATSFIDSSPTIENQELEIIIKPKDDLSFISEHQYQIQKGDCLWEIAEKELGSGYRWVEIYQLNRAVIGDNPDLIYPDVVLELPQS